MATIFAFEYDDLSTSWDGGHRFVIEEDAEDEEILRTGLNARAAAAVAQYPHSNGGRGRRRTSSTRSFGGSFSLDETVDSVIESASDFLVLDEELCEDEDAVETIELTAATLGARAAAARVSTEDFELLQVVGKGGYGKVLF